MQMVLALVPMSLWLLTVGADDRAAFGRTRVAKWGSLSLIVLLNAILLWTKLYKLSGLVSIVASPGVTWGIPVFVWCSVRRREDKIVHKD